MRLGVPLAALLAVLLAVAGCAGVSGPPNTPNDVYKAFQREGVLLTDNVVGGGGAILNSYWMMPSGNRLGFDLLVDVYKSTQDAKKVLQEEGLLNSPGTATTKGPSGRVGRRG